MFVHSADKMAEMRTKFDVIQAKLMSVWCFTVQCYLSFSLTYDDDVISNTAKYSETSYNTIYNFQHFIVIEDRLSPLVPSSTSII